MPIEDIQTPKAPADWKPSSDQQQRITSDSRLKALSRDELYLFFNKPKPKPQFSEAFHERAKAAPASGGGFLGAVMSRVTNAMKGG